MGASLPIGWCGSSGGSVSSACELPAQISSELEAAICKLRRMHPSWGQRRIAHELGRAGGAVPSLSSIYRTLARNGLLVPGARRRKRSDYLRWERNRPMELWQMDVMGGVHLADGSEAKVLTGIDDHSRYCVATGVMASANARTPSGTGRASFRSRATYPPSTPT